MPIGVFEYDVRATEEDGSVSQFKYLHRNAAPLMQGETFRVQRERLTVYIVVRMLSDTAVEAKWKMGGPSCFGGFGD